MNSLKMKLWVDMLKLDLVMYVLWYYKPEGCWIQLESSQIDVGFPGGSDGKESAHNAETQVWSLGWEYTLEDEMTTHSSNLAWRLPRAEESGRLQSMGSQRIGHDWVTHTHTHTHTHTQVDASDRQVEELLNFSQNIVITINEKQNVPGSLALS